MVKTYKKHGKTLEGCGGAMIPVGRNSHTWIWLQLAVVFKNQLFLPPFNPKHELASPCLGTHAQKPWLGWKSQKTRFGLEVTKTVVFTPEWLKSSCFPSPKLKSRGQIQDWSSWGTSCFSQVQIWPPLFINPGVNTALDLPIIFTVIITPPRAVPSFPWVSRGWWVFQLPLESAQMPLSLWWGFPGPLWMLEQGRMG